MRVRWFFRVKKNEKSSEKLYFPPVGVERRSKQIFFFFFLQFINFWKRSESMSVIHSARILIELNCFPHSFSKGWQLKFSASLRKRNKCVLNYYKICAWRKICVAFFSHFSCESGSASYGKRFCFTNLIINLSEYESEAIFIWQDEKNELECEGKLNSSYRQFVDPIVVTKNVNEDENFLFNFLDKNSLVL